jgi:hypothetical protein
MVDYLEFAVADIGVDRLRNADAKHVKTRFLRDFRDLVRGVHRVIPAV